MGSYIANFTVYTMAMLGLIFFALFVYKKFMNGGFSSNSSKILNIEETMNINPRKSLLVVRAGNERFLVASDVDRTTLISKLSDNNTPVEKFKNFERFQNIPQEEYLPNTNIQKEFPQSSRLIDSNVVENPKPMIHLEPITEKNPQGANLRRKMDNRVSMKQQHLNKQNNVVLNFNEYNSKQQNLTTIKEMAKKINEL